jgi:LPXTG-motif cell wall-anchored protein
MKALVTGVLIGLLTFGVGAAAGAYPPGAASLTLSPSTVSPGGSFGATFTGCTLGEVVSVSVSGDSDSATCTGTGGGAARAIGQPATGTATVTLTAPTAPGTYVVTATAAESGITATAILTVAAPTPSGELPTTGSDSSVPIAQIAAGVLMAGLGLAGVAIYRRRSAAST